MMNSKPVIIFLFVMLAFSGCKKEEESWTYCMGCELVAWVGNYDGTGEYYNDNPPKTEIDVPVLVSIENNSGSTLKTTVTVVDKFDATFTSSKNNNNYYYTVPESDVSLSLNLSKRSSDFKLTGTVKIYKGTSNPIIVDQSISFVVYKLKD